MDISTVQHDVDDTEAEDRGPEEAPQEGAVEDTAEGTAEAEVTEEGSPEAAEGDTAEPQASAEPEEAPAAEPAAPRLGPGEEKDDETLKGELLALLFASPEPLTRARLVDLLERPAPARVKGLLQALRDELPSGPLPVVLEEVAGTWRLATHPDQGETLQRLQKEPKPERITAAGLETLAIVAYRQPVTKAEVEAIRGVGAGPMLRTLVDRRLIKVTGRADQPGSPLLYGTTKEFLERFGLASLKELPRDGELAEE